MLSLFHHLHHNSNADNIGPDVGTCHDGTSDVLAVADGLEEELARKEGYHNEYVERNGSVVPNADM